MKAMAPVRRSPIPTTLKRLIYLDALAGAPSLDEAARICDVGSTTLALGICELEKTFGFRLVMFEKDAHVFTGEGRMILARARPLLEDLGQLREAVFAMRAVGRSAATG